MKRLALQLALAVAAVFTLTAAAPALACGDDCPMHKAAAAGAKTGADAKAAPADKSAPKKDEAKPAEKAAPAAAAPAGEKKAQAVPPCKCEKGGKGCTCKKGECTCPNCAGAKVAAGEQPKPKCDCDNGKDCGCTKDAKGNCTCKKGTPKPKSA